MKSVACYSTVVYIFYKRLPSILRDFFFFLLVQFKKGEIRAASPCLSVCVYMYASCFPDSYECTGMKKKMHAYLQSKEFSF